jgi:hypothetical protein
MRVRSSIAAAVVAVGLGMTSVPAHAVDTQSATYKKFGAVERAEGTAVKGFGLVMRDVTSNGPGTLTISGQPASLNTTAHTYSWTIAQVQAFSTLATVEDAGQPIGTIAVIG